MLNNLIDHVRNHSVYLPHYFERYRARCDSEEMDSLLYLLTEFRTKLKSGNTTARYVRCWLIDGTDVIKHDECVGMCLFPDEVREFLSYGVYYTVSFPFCFLHYLLSEANAAQSDYPEIAKILSDSPASVIAHLMDTYHFCRSTVLSMITKLVSGEDALEEWPIRDDRLTAVKNEIDSLVDLASQRTHSTTVRRSVYYGTRREIIRMAQCVQQQCDAAVLPFEFGLLVPILQKDVVLAYLAAYLTDHPFFAGMQPETTMKLPPLLQLETWCGEGIAFSQEELSRCWARSTRDAFAYLDAYFVGVRESSTLLFVDYMHQEVRFLTTEWERCKCVGFAHLQLLAEWRQQTRRVADRVVTRPFIGAFSLEQAMTQGEFNTFFGLNPQCFSLAALQPPQPLPSHAPQQVKEGEEQSVKKEEQWVKEEQWEAGRLSRWEEDALEQFLALDLFHRLCLAVAENSAAAAAWVRQFVIQMLFEPDAKPCRGLVLMDARRSFAEEFVKALQSLFTFSTALSMDHAGRRKQLPHDRVARALLVHYESDRTIEPETMLWLEELVRLRHRVDFCSEADVCVRPAFCRVVVTADSLSRVPFFSLRDRATFAYFATDPTAMTQEELAVFSELRRRAWFSTLLFHALLEEGPRPWDWRAMEDTRLVEALVEGRADSPVQFICWYVKHSGMHARLQKPALGDEKRERDVRDADELYEEYRQFCVEMKKEAVDFLGFARSVLVEFHPLVDYRVVEGAQQFLICREEMKGSLWASRPVERVATPRTADHSSSERFAVSSVSSVCWRNARLCSHSSEMSEKKETCVKWDMSKKWEEV